jgi:hypothetical protein
MVNFEINGHYILIQLQDSKSIQIWMTVDLKEIGYWSIACHVKREMSTLVLCYFRYLHGFDTLSLRPV